MGKGGEERGGEKAVPRLERVVMDSDHDGLFLAHAFVGVLVWKSTSCNYYHTRSRYGFMARSVDYGMLLVGEVDVRGALNGELEALEVVKRLN